MRTSLLLAVLCSAGCVVGGIVPPNHDAGPTDAGPTDAGPTDAGMDAGPILTPITVASPAGETHTGPLSVTLTSTPAATITYTTDGSDPTSSATATSGPSPVSVLLTAPAQVTLAFFGHNGNSVEIPHSEHYTLLDDLGAASIEGSLIVPASLMSGTAQVWLFDHDPTAAGAMGAPIATDSVDPNAPGGATYSFQGLAAGNYWIAATWWPGMATGNPSALGFAHANPIALDPSMTATSRADFIDVYIGLCDPAGTGVDGVVNLGTSLLSDTASIIAYAQPVNFSSMQMPSNYAVAIGTGAARPFAMCGTSPGSLYLYATANATGVNTPAAFAVDPGNPVNVTHVASATFYLGEANPSAGAIAGTVTLNGALPGGTVAVAASTTPWTMANLAGITTATMVDDTHYSYSIPSLEPGGYYLLVTVQSADMLSATFPQEVEVTVGGTATVMSDLVASVGRITGTVTVTGAPSGVGKVAVLASPPGSAGAAAQDVVTLGAADSTGSQSAAFTLFGLPDDTFNVAAIVDVNNDGTFTDDFAAGHYGLSTTMPAIVGGDSATADVTVALQ